MPIYVYECVKCDLKIELNRKIDERDDVASVTIEHCPVYKKSMDKQIDVVKAGKSTSVFGAMMSVGSIEGTYCIGCELKRCVTSGSFKI